MESLPTELLLLIFKYCSLKDTFRLSHTCTRLRALICSLKLDKRRILQLYKQPALLRYVQVPITAPMFLHIRASLKDLRVQTPEICMAVVKRRAMELQYVKEQTPKLCMAAVLCDPHALFHVKEQTPEICSAAVHKDGNVLCFVKEQTPELCRIAVRDKAYALYHVRVQTPEICIHSVEIHWTALALVRDQTFEICSAAVNNNKGALRYIRDDEMRTRVCKECLVESYCCLCGNHRS